MLLCIVHLFPNCNREKEKKAVLLWFVGCNDMKKENEKQSKRKWGINSNISSISSSRTRKGSVDVKKERKKKSTHTAAAQTHVKNFHVFSFENARTCDYTDNFCFFLSLFFPKNFTCIFGCVFLFSQSLLKLCSFSLKIHFDLSFCFERKKCPFISKTKRKHTHSLTRSLYVRTHSRIRALTHVALLFPHHTRAKQHKTN